MGLCGRDRFGDDSGVGNVGTCGNGLHFGVEPPDAPLELISGEPTGLALIKTHYNHVACEVR